MADARDSGQDVRPVADQGCAADGCTDLAVLDSIRLTRAEYEFSTGDVDLSAGEGYGVQTIVDGFQDLLRIILPREHEGVGHAWQGDVCVTFTSPVARRGGTHQAGVQSVLHVPDEDAVLNQGIALCGRALVIDVERSSSPGKRAVIDDGHTVCRNALPQFARKG